MGWLQIVDTWLGWQRMANNTNWNIPGDLQPLIRSDNSQEGTDVLTRHQFS